MSRRLPVLLALMLSAVPWQAAAQQNEPVSGSRSGDMVMDAMLLRPLGFVSTVFGAALTVVALPFTIPSGSVQASACELILRPTEYTFKRPLGDFSGHGETRCNN